jgi:hypothetical protein
LNLLDKEQQPRKFVIRLIDSDCKEFPVRYLASIIGGCVLALLVAAESAYPLGLGAYGFVRKGRDAAHLSTFSYGLLLDTALARDSLFNFRYQVGFGTTMQNEDMFGSFGFGLVRTPYLRFWLGPQLGMSFKQRDTFPMPTFGAVLGLNVNFLEHYTFSVDGGYRWMMIFHDNDGDTMGWGQGEPFLGIALIFRFNDDFGPGAAPSQPVEAGTGSEQ